MTTMTTTTELIILPLAHVRRVIINFGFSFVLYTIEWVNKERKFNEELKETSPNLIVAHPSIYIYNYTFVPSKYS